MSAVRPGYKQTEVGVIPEDWEVMPICKIAHIQTGPFGTLLKASEYSLHGGTPLISVREIGEGFIKVDFKTPYVSAEIIKRMPEYVLHSGDVVFGRKGAVDRSALVADKQEGWFLGSDGIRIRLSNGCNSEFVACQLQQQQIRRWLLQHATGTTMPSLNQEVLGRVILALPTLAEQTAIAAVLSDLDAMIQSLDQLIAKKRNIKQGAMQELLTGKRRLSGFSGEWESLTINNIASIKARIGWQGLTTAEYKKTGEYYLVTGTDFFDGRINWANCCFVNANRYVQDKNIQLVIGDVLITKDGTIGKVGIIDYLPGPATLNSGVFVIRPQTNLYDHTFLFYIFSSKIFDEFLTKLQAGSTIIHLYQKDFVNFKVFLPPTLAEQKAIAAVLSDMDAEIAALERKRDKYKAVKRGMMQELLTGKIRLV